MTSNFPSFLFALIGLALFAACPPTDEVADVVVQVDAEPPAPECPTRLTFTALTDTVTHLGNTGFTHNAVFPEGSEFAAEVTQCDEECANCRFRGPLDDNPDFKRTRCITDTSIVCDENTVCPNQECRASLTGEGLACADTGSPCESDADCLPGQCYYFVGAPQGSPQNTSCFATIFQSPIGEEHAFEGLMNFQTGHVNFQKWGFLVAGSDASQGYCEVCNDDPQRNDGDKGGTCQTPTYEGLKRDIPGPPRECDISGFSSFENRAGTHSLDCSVPMSLILNLSVENLSSSSSTRWTLVEGEQPVCGANGELCWCGLCEGTSDPCHSNSDCQGVACTATTTAPAAAVRNNICADECVWSNTDLQGFCTGVVGFDGDGMPILRPNQPCFPASGDLIVSGGTQVLDNDVYSVTVSNISCVPESQSPVTNTAVGLPAPIFVQDRFRIEVE